MTLRVNESTRPKEANKVFDFDKENEVSVSLPSRTRYEFRELSNLFGPLNLRFIISSFFFFFSFPFLFHSQCGSLNMVFSLLVFVTLHLSGSIYAFLRTNVNMCLIFKSWSKLIIIHAK